MKPTRVWAQHRISDDESFSVSVTIGNDYPDALNQAEVTATRMMCNIVDHAIEAYAEKADSADVTD